MKNIFLIRTHNPSKLYEFGGSYFLSYKAQENFRSYNIIITSDENAKHGEWCFYEKDKENPIKFQRGEYLNAKKIVLTNSPDLIADGVQEIQNQLLEWFIRNPNCEYVKIGSEFKCFDKNDFCVSCCVYDTDYTKLIYYPIIETEEEPFDGKHKQVLLLEELSDKIKSEQESGEKQKAYDEVFDWLERNDYLTDSKIVLQNEFKKK